MITGWAHSEESLAPLATALSGSFRVKVQSAAKRMAGAVLPDAEVVLGHSLGGLLAMEQRPPSCEKLILLSSTARFCAAPDYPCGVEERVLKRMILQFKRNPKAVLDAFFKQVHAPDPFSHSAPSSSDQDLLLSGLDYLLKTDLRTQVSRVNLPVLLLHGTADEIIPASASKWLKKQLPTAMLHLFEGGGHALFAHQTDWIAEKIEAFQSLQAAPKSTNLHGKH
jgi:pimeloyl-[acyl-carrier protein] methyl ester esterase